MSYFVAYLVVAGGVAAAAKVARGAVRGVGQLAAGDVRGALTEAAGGLAAPFCAACGEVVKLGVEVFVAAGQIAGGEEGLLTQRHDRGAARCPSGEELDGVVD